MTENPPQPIRIGVSSCLLGQEVRYDGGHKRNTYLTQALSPYFEFVTYCPEVAVGMGVPRAPIRLVEHTGGIHAVGISDAQLDMTAALQTYATQVAEQAGDLTGYIFKKDSPSCGMQRVKVFDYNDVPQRRGRGIYADILMQKLPLLPCEEEGRLMDPRLRENFIERVFIYYRWQQLLKQGLTPAALVEFHARHKFNLLAHDEISYRRLGRLVAEVGNSNITGIASNYIEVVMQALQKLASRKTHTNVLMHVMGFLKKQIDAEDKKELLESIDAYRQGLLPLIVPLTLLKHHLRKNPQPYIEQQYYMNPYPEELMLRNSL